MPRVPPRLTANARDLRRRATDAERILWNHLRSYRSRFTRQLVIGPYIVDLACREAKIAIELDGSQHIGSARDVRRTAFLEGLGWRVIRFWNSEVTENSDGVAEAILVAVSERIDTHPQPLPVPREGRKRRPRTRLN